MVYPNANSFISEIRHGTEEWKKNGEFAFDIHEEYVGRSFVFFAAVRSTRKFHAEQEHVLGGIDDKVIFSYEILPPRHS